MTLLTKPDQPARDYEYAVRMSSGTKLFSFPNPVNDVAARAVATGVVVMGLLVAALGWGWVLIPLTYGFVARVSTGPTLSPLGQFAVRVVAPALPAQAKLVAGPPKRFAQGIGAAFTLTASILWLTGNPVAARWVIGALVVAASLEAFLGFCLGCKIFALGMRAGVVPESICEECNDLSLRYPQFAAGNAD